MTPRLQQKYDSEIRGALASKFGMTNRLAVPRLDKSSSILASARRSTTANTSTALCLTSRRFLAKSLS